MKKYMLPALISLAISSSLAVAEEAVPQQPPTPPAVEQPAPMSENEGMAQVRQAHRQYMQEQMEKIRQMQDPEERRRLVQDQMQEMQHVMQEMQGLLQEGGASPAAMGYGMGGPGVWGGGPEQGFGGPGGGSWGGGPEQGFGGPGGGSWGGGPEQGYGMGMGRGGRPGMMSNAPRHQSQQSHQAAMERSLANIEKMLEQLVANQPK